MLGWFPVIPFEFNRKILDSLRLIIGESKNKTFFDGLILFSFGVSVTMSATCVSISDLIELTTYSYFVFLNWNSSCINQFQGLGFPNGGVFVLTRRMLACYLRFTFLFKNVEYIESDKTPVKQSYKMLEYT